MALQAGQRLYQGRISDADGRDFVVATGGVADTAIASGSTAAPGAGGALATIASGSLPAGVYRVRATLLLTGTAETALTNIALKAGATTKATLLSLSGSLMQVELDRVTLDGASALTLNAVAAATAGSIYNVVLAATRVE